MFASGWSGPLAELAGHWGWGFGRFGGQEARLFAGAGRVRDASPPAAMRAGGSKPVAAARPPWASGGANTRGAGGERVEPGCRCRLQARIWP